MASSVYRLGIVLAYCTVRASLAISSLTTYHAHVHGNAWDTHRIPLVAGLVERRRGNTRVSFVLCFVGPYREHEVDEVDEVDEV